MDVTPIVAALNANDSETLSMKGPVRIEQGKADATVFQTFTDQLVADYTKRGLDVTYKTYNGVDHGGAVTSAKSAADATKFVVSRL